MIETLFITYEKNKLIGFSIIIGKLLINIINDTKLQNQI